MTVTACPRIESPRNSRRSLWPIPPFSYAYERCVRASVSNSDSISSCNTEFNSATPSSPPGVTLPEGSDSDVGDLTALVLQEQRSAGGVLDDLRAVREAVGDLAVLDGLHEGHRGGLPLRTAGVRVGTRLAALGNGHDCLFSVFGDCSWERLPGVLFGVGGCFGLEALQRGPPGVEHLAVLPFGAIRQFLPRVGVETGAA